jgi:dihydroxyacetone kinase-like protein
VSDLVPALIDAAVAAVAAAEGELTRLDQAIGDGDHGSNMARGFEAIAAARAALAPLDLGEALQKAGMTLVTTVGGASGPLYGSLLMAMGKAARAGAGPAAMLAEGVEAVRRRGKSEAGAKTMLDVLVPVLDAVRAAPTPAARLAAARVAADAGLEATRPMQASRGRASFLGERSRGHLDPGAASARLLIHAACDALERVT